jgi:hypothetical protein
VIEAIEVTAACLTVNLTTVLLVRCLAQRTR